MRRRWKMVDVAETGNRPWFQVPLKPVHFAILGFLVILFYALVLRPLLKSAEIAAERAAMRTALSSLGEHVQDHLSDHAGRLPNNGEWRGLAARVVSSDTEAHAKPFFIVVEDFVGKKIDSIPAGSAIALACSNKQGSNVRFVKLKDLPKTTSDKTMDMCFVLNSDFGVHRQVGPHD